MLEFKIDKEKCIKCGLCSKECPVLIIDGKTEYPQIKDGKEKNCLKCQHCLAVCPTGALSILGKNPDDSILVGSNDISYNSLNTHVRTRRSIRKFKDQLLEKELINEVLESSSYAPTSHNKNNVLLSVTYDKEVLLKVKNLFYDSIKKAVETNTIPEDLKYFSKFQAAWENKNIDIIFRNAPHMIIASVPKVTRATTGDTYIALSYFELLANTKGIGTLWNGFIRYVLEYITPELKKTLGIPVENEIGGAMLFGVPDVKFTRSIQSEGLHLHEIKL